MAESNHLLVLGDQLTDQVGPLRALLDGTAGFASPVLVAEVVGDRRVRRHVQAVAMQVAAVRACAADLVARGIPAEVVAAETTEQLLEEIRRRHRPHGLTLMDPAQPDVRTSVENWAAGNGIPVEIVENELWLTSRAEWADYRSSRRELRMEHWYRRVRSARGWLMDPADPRMPIGGRWNLDTENRRRLDRDARVPTVPVRAHSSVLQAAIGELSAARRPLFGSSETVRWPTTRSEALQELETFCTERLAGFGPYEDAMSRDHDHLFHSLLSPSINLGLLTPREVCERALREHAARPDEIPLSSIEGFIRQILGWREFMHHAYLDFAGDWEHDNGLEARESLPEFYWTGETTMACVSRVVRKVAASGHAHHIERLMVLGNFALLFGVVPQQVDAWFLEAFVDAFPWVVTPNVVAMSQFADLGRITSKPYIAGGAYISRMGDDCGSCAYDPKASTGERACPFTTLYWTFIDRHADRFARNPRMATQVRAWSARPEATRSAILRRGEEVRALVDRKSL